MKGVRARMFPGQRFLVGGGRGCARPNEHGITLSMASREIHLATFSANQGGGYRSPDVRVPNDIELGDHQVIVRTRDFTYAKKVVVAQLRGGRARRASYSGGNVAMLLLWTLALLGTAFLLARRRLPLQVQAVATRLRTGNKGPRALPMPDVPRIDTAAFVPLRPRADVAPEILTEADVSADGPGEPSGNAT
jgi:hypothetical protein